MLAEKERSEGVAAAGKVEWESCSVFLRQARDKIRSQTRLFSQLVRSPILLFKPNEFDRGRQVKPDAHWVQRRIRWRTVNPVKDVAQPMWKAMPLRSEKENTH